MSVLNIRNYPKIKTKFTTDPKGDIVSLGWRQDAEEIDFVCICCLHRWRYHIPLSMMIRPEWMGAIVCPAIGCGAEGQTVRG